MRHMEYDRTKNVSKATGIPFAHEKGKGNSKTSQVTKTSKVFFKQRKSRLSPWKIPVKEFI